MLDCQNVRVPIDQDLVCKEDKVTSVKTRNGSTKRGLACKEQCKGVLKKGKEG